MNEAEAILLVQRLLSMKRENEWIEFKLSNSEPQAIGEYLSALSNSAALNEQPYGYILWGINNESKSIEGTNFRPHEKKIGDQELENWLLTQLTPPINFDIIEIEQPAHLVIFQIQAASSIPVQFRGTEYIRIGSYKKTLKDHPEKERQLWRFFSQTPFEQGYAKTHVTADDVLELVDYPKCFRLMKSSLPDNKSAIIDKFISEKIIVRKTDIHFDITNIGAILFAYDLNTFGNLIRKAPRVIRYKGENKVETRKEQTGTKGYAAGFEGLIKYINDQLPSNEFIEEAFRKEVPVFPEIAIRELVANALIHQDFSISGAGPLIELFSDRVEISNPGRPLIDPIRFIDEPPQSRNDKIASLMRRMNICEERGTGIDKVIFHVEAFQLPAPVFRATDNATVTILYGPRSFSEMTKEDKIRACYQHACLCAVSGKQMTNSSLRKRFDIEAKNYPVASKIIKDTLDRDLIKPYSPTSTSRKDARYLPFWG